MISNEISNNNIDSFNNNTAGHDLIYNQNTSIIQNKDNSNILVPALNRLAEAIENKHRENIDNIQSNIEQKMSIEGISIKQPNEDFMYRYVEGGRTISDKEIQKVWADLYLKEAKNPSSVSFRTLEIVKNLTFNEMNLFLRLLEYCFKVNDCGYIPNETCKEFSPLIDITRLADIGLIKSDISLSWTLTFSANKNVSLVLNSTILLITNPTAKDINVSIPVYVLTDAGFQLSSAINAWIKEENGIKFAKYFKNRYKMLNISLHEIISFDSNRNVHYKRNDLLL